MADEKSKNINEIVDQSLVPGMPAGPDADHEAVERALGRRKSAGHTTPGSLEIARDVYYRTGEVPKGCLSDGNSITYPNGHVDPVLPKDKPSDL